MKLSGKALAIILLFVGLVLVNYLAANLPARLDTTAERIYTLSTGTQGLLGKIEEPITLDFYFTKSATGLPIAYKNYATRVEEMLRQYARASRGKITLNVIDPRPDTPEEERATAARIQPQLIPTTGEQIQFGLVATQADQHKTLSALNPQREQFLEYDLSQLIYSVQQIDKKKLGLLTSLPLQGTSPQEAQMMMMMRQQPQPGQFVTTEWEKTFQIIRIESTATELPAGLDALAVIHPQNLAPKLQFAVDQFILGGRPVFLAVDPASQYFKRQSNPQQSMMGGPTPNLSSDLAPLLSAYSIGYDPQKIVGDLENATQVQTQGGQLARYPVWLNLRRGNFNATSAPTGQLNSALFIEPGFLTAQTGATTTFTPLVESSAQSGDVAAMALQFSQPDAIARQITPTGKTILAALVTGNFKTAFPAGGLCQIPGTLLPFSLDHPGHDQLGNPVAMCDVNLLTRVVIDHDNLDLAPIAGVNDTRCIHYPQTGTQSETASGMNESGEPRRQSDSNSCRNQRALAGRDAHGFCSPEIKTSIAGMLVCGKRQVLIETSDEHGNSHGLTSQFMPADSPARQAGPPFARSTIACSTCSRLPFSKKCSIGTWMNKALARTAS